MNVREIAEAKLAEKRAAEGKPAEPKPRPKRVERNEDDDPDVFELARKVDTTTVLDRLSISHDEKFATCPGCGEEGALICKNGGIKCLHARCANAGPPGGKNPGFRSTIDMVANAEHLKDFEAALRICEWGGIEVPERKKKTGSGKEPPEGRFDGEWAESGQQATRYGAVPVSASVEWHDARSIFTPLPATEWVVKDLQICPGRPGLWCGYGYVGKTITAQTIALAMAGGVSVFGKFDIRRGVVRHFDHEQGKHATFKRYQRIAIGMDLESAELDEHLFVTVFPPVFLNMPNAVDVYSRLCEGTDFVIIDALRGATPGEDENDSKIRRCLDNLTLTSEKTGATFLVIHHTGKPQEGHADQRTKPRGSSGIFDACGPVFLLSGSKESPHKLVSQQKAPAEAEGGAVDDFFLTVDDVARGFNPKAGVRVTHRTKEEITGGAASEAEARDKKIIEHNEKILTLVRGNPGANVNQLRALARPLRNPDIDDAVERLVMSGKLEIKPGPNRQKLHFEGSKT